MTTCVAERATQYVRPRTNVIESAGHYTLSMELPGIAKDQIDVQVEEGVLTVKTARPESETSDTYLVRERLKFDYLRSFSLGEEIDPEHIEAKLEAGVLTLQLKKVPATTPQRIEIR